LTTHYWSVGTTDLIICQNYLALFAIRPANLQHSDWEAIASEIKAWCASRYKIVKMRTIGSAGDSIGLNVTGNAAPDTVIQALKAHLQEVFQPVA
jgi:hypothetical protein